MNALSWLIYAADVAGTLDVFCAAVVLLGVPAAIVARCTWDGDAARAWDQRTEDHRLYPTRYQAPEGERPEPRWPLKHLVGPIAASVVVAATLAVVTPASGTLYAIAASEVGEEVVKSATAAKAVKALDAWLDKQIATGKE